MKNIKNFIFAASGSFLVLLSLSAAAQNIGAGFKDKTPQQRAQLQTSLMKSKLKLDSAQGNKVAAINLKYALEIEPVLKSNDNRLKRLREAMTIQKAKDEELKKVFNTAQYKQYEEVESELKQKMMSKMN